MFTLSQFPLSNSPRNSITEIYRLDPPRRRECLYYLSLGHFKMGNFEEARRFNGESQSSDSLRSMLRFSTTGGVSRNARAVPPVDQAFSQQQKLSPAR